MWGREDGEQHIAFFPISRPFHRTASTMHPRCAKCNMLRQQRFSHFFVTTSVAESRTWFYFSQRLLQWFYWLLQLCNLSHNAFAQSANQDSSYPLSGPPRSEFCELLVVPLYTVTPLFVHLQCYTIKCCETSGVVWYSYHWPCACSICLNSRLWLWLQSLAESQQTLHIK